MAKPKKGNGIQKAGGNGEIVFSGNVKAFDSVKKLMVEGYRVEDISQLIERDFPDEDREHLFLCVGEYFASLSRANPSVLTGWCYDATRELYQRMLAVGDFTGALRAIKQMRDFQPK